VWSCFHSPTYGVKHSVRAQFAIVDIACGIPHNGAMTRKDIINYYGSQAEAARRLGVKPQTILEWEVVGVPDGRQYQVELATGGALRAARPADRKAILA